jgi:2-hydroxychromene-2-carboxylate isomerase
VLASRPGLVVVRRHFPLDPSCNPAVKRAIHPAACALARAAICAEAQGQAARMDDALFRDQGKGTAPAEIARGLGLDMDRFSACLSSPETSRRLSEDVAAGIRDGVRAIPTYLVDGTAHVGTLPPSLAAPAGTAAGR